MRNTGTRGRVLVLCGLCVLLGGRSVRGISGYENPAYKGTMEARLIDGGYEGVVVAINSQVAEDLALIDRIKTVLSDFSGYLHQITNERVYLSEVRILIPLTWSDNPNYASPVSERFEESDVRIDNPPMEELSKNPNMPYTNNPTPCGSQGLFIHLTPDYLTDERIARVYGPYNKALAHEWAHYRWGVFDEYPKPGEQHFYVTSSGRVEAVRCSAAIKGDFLKPGTRDNCAGLPDDSCRFFDERNAGTGRSSLMYKQFLSYVTEFCDDEDGVDSKVKHNAEAPNAHNRQCGSKSVWQVMREHSDFSGTSSRVSLRPTQFVNVRQRPTRYVLVIDNSMSMTLRILILRQASYIFIHEVLLDDEELGIVQFNTNPSVRADLTTVGSSRSELVSKLPTELEGATSIAGGVSLGLEILNRTGELSRLGGRMIVLTDGEETSDPRIPEIINMTDSVLIHTIAIGQNVDSNLESLARRTGGRQFLHQDSSTALFDIFSQFGVESRGSESEELVSEYLPNFDSKVAPTKILFVRDNTLRGRITTYVGVINRSGFGLGPQGQNQFEVYLMSPTGQRIDSTYDQTVSIFKISTVSLERGTWALNIRNMADITVSVSVLVLARTGGGQSDQSTTSPITASGFWGTPNLRPPQVQAAYVSLARGYNPVIDPVVNVTIETPSGTDSMQLYDDGIGADITGGDGVYSGFFSALNGVGRYSAQFSIRGDSRIVMGARVGMGAAIDPELGNPEWTVQYEEGGYVQRTVTGGSFKCEDEACNRANSPDGNMYGPYRVTDLRVTNVDRGTGGSGTIDLVFTAPGADLMSGTASSYDLRWSTDFPAFRKVFETGETLGTARAEGRPFISKGDPQRPLVARSQEMFTVRLPASENVTITYIFALTATDGTFTSPPSNMASVKLPVDTTVTVAPVDDQTEKPGSNSLPIVGAGLSLLLVLLVMAVLLLLLARRRRTRRKKDDVDPGDSGSVDGGHVNGAAMTVTAEMGLPPSIENSLNHDKEATSGTSGAVGGSRRPTAAPRGGAESGSLQRRSGLTAEMSDRPSDEFRDALIAAQLRRSTHPSDGLDDGAHTNDGSLPGGEGGDYTFLPPDRRRGEIPRQATIEGNPSDYQFLPAESREYGDLRMAHLLDT